MTAGRGDPTEAGEAPGRRPLAMPRLRALATRDHGASGGSGGERGAGPETAEGSAGACDLCAEPIGREHRHLVDLSEPALRCVCRPCSILFDRPGAGGGRYRPVPGRVRFLADFRLGELDWLALRVPVELAFFYRSTPAERVVALYPGPMGATESLLALDHWTAMEARNPVLAEMEPDVEALLVNRTGGVREGWLVPIDACYELVGIFRTRWKGLSGGREVWKAVDDYFAGLRRRARGARGAPARRSRSPGGGA